MSATKYKEVCPMFTILLVPSSTLRALAAEPSLRGIIDTSPLQQLQLQPHVTAAEALHWARSYADSGMYTKVYIRCGGHTMRIR